jgi:hypothetical protein
MALTRRMAALMPVADHEQLYKHWHVWHVSSSGDRRVLIGADPRQRICLSRWSVPPSMTARRSLRARRARCGGNSAIVHF